MRPASYGVRETRRATGRHCLTSIPIGKTASKRLFESGLQAEGRCCSPTYQIEWLNAVRLLLGASNSALNGLKGSVVMHPTTRPWDHSAVPTGLAQRQLFISSGVRSPPCEAGLP